MRYESDSLLMHSLRRYSLIELEEIMEKVRTEILRRELEPMRYEVAALRQHVEELKQLIKDNI
jgi:hypothetical protein